MGTLAGRVILLRGWKRVLAAFLAGALAAFAQAPFDFLAVCFISFPVLVWLLDGVVSTNGGGIMRRALPFFATGWWFGFGYFVAGLWWTGAAVLVEGYAFAWALPFAVLGLPALLALFYGFACFVAWFFWSEGIGRILGLAFAFGLAEWLRSFVLTGFPWNAVGYAAMPIPLLMQSVKIVGMNGMNVLSVFLFSLPALLVSRNHLRPGFACGLALVLLHLGYGYASLAAAPPAERMLPVRIVQPSIEQSEKWDEDIRDSIFKTYLDLSSEPTSEGRASPRLIIWPETAVPFLFTDRPDALVAVGEVIKDGQMLFAGAVRSEAPATSGGQTRYYNAVVAINSAGEIVDAVDKVHLVPFGEYVPLGGLLRKLGITELVESVGPFSPGSLRSTLILDDGIRALPFICYEIIFPDLVLADAAGADFILNLTNDAWFGDTPGPYQHFRQARIRAVEAGLPLVRAANNGISAVVDPHGRIVNAFALNAYGVLDADVPLGPAGGPSIGKPGVNGFMLLALFGISALIVSVRYRFKSN
ncbi:apolipoprotein N-acyltransferase [Mesorhizobium sp. J18]|uniref:apolipoprotein N-acyltransferase n=1 Tax=Mesorhizobium sp. J18 TaxID=935263 RepID=UPI00119CCCEC|nr:apolipoprotein N-acyltransferase [Mesorhizobium sp. J18]